MTSKDRVRAALRRQPVDRVPVFMWFHPATARQLALALDIPESRVADAFGNDVRQTWVNNNHAMEGIVHKRDGEGHTDFWGVEWVKDGPFNQIARSPLQGAPEWTVRDYRFPEACVGRLLAAMAPVAALAKTHFIGCDVSPCVFEMAARLRGMEMALLDLAASPRLSGVLLERSADFAVRLAEAACAQFPLDWLWTGDDVAGQQGLLMSPACWREAVKPQLARVVAVGKAHGLPVAYHCCGALRPIVPDLIEIGVDVLNPIQCNCPGMAPGDLKRDFGDALAFMGGVDTQRLLPHGSPDEVRRATARLVDIMGSDGGGYILAASHTVPPETPLDNIFAMYEVAGQERALIYDRAADIRRQIRAAGDNGNP